MVKKPTKNRVQKMNKKKSFLITLSVIVLFILCWITYSSMRSYPLGEKLDYIGKVSGGNYYPLSSSKPYTDYYYATDLPPEEIAQHYFKSAEVTDSPKNGQDGWYELKTKKGVVTIKIQKRSDMNLALIKSVSKDYIFTISDYEYDALESSL